MELNNFIIAVIRMYRNQEHRANTFQNITDEIFLMIQGNRRLMHDYLLVVAAQGNFRVVNSRIAQRIKRDFGLTNFRRNNHPESLHIQSYTEFFNFPEIRIGL